MQKWQYPSSDMKTDNIANKTKVFGEDFPDRLMGSPHRIIATKADYPDGLSYPFHKHVPIQFLYASAGVMTVSTPQGVWVVPPFCAVWIPSETDHKIFALGSLALRSLYIRPEAILDPPSQCCVVSVPPLLRELILHAAEFPADYQKDSPEERVMDVIWDMVQTLDTAPLRLPLPQDERLLKITQHLMQDPADKRTLDEWGGMTGATSRTLARLFQKETGMSFTRWRQRARLLEALRQLARGESVTFVAMNLGYDSVSAFVAMFRKALGSTPGQYFNQLS